MKKYLYGIVLLAGLSYSIAIPYQSDSIQILVGYSLAFLGYLGLYSLDKRNWNFTYLLLFALMARILMIPFFPNLSDDIYRFYWDAMVTEYGMSPYAYLPSEIIGEIGEEAIYQKLNSPNYYSVYPPFNQLLYFIAFKISSGLEGFAYALKIEYILCEFLGLIYLGKLTKLFEEPNQRWFIYSLNPLVVIEGIGNLHIEVVMVSFLIISLYYLLSIKKLWKSMFFYFGAVGVKIVPLLLVPYIFLKENKSNQLRIVGYGLIFMLLFFGPLIFALDLDTFSQSLDLYFRKFEFNASFYYLFRFIGFTFLGYNLISYIGPILSILVFISILFFAFKSKSAQIEQWLEFILMGWSLYLFFATIIHPWYILPLILFASLTKWNFPIIWSYLIVLSYMSYGTEPFEENLLLVSVEYIILFGFLVWEGKRNGVAVK